MMAGLAELMLKLISLGLFLDASSAAVLVNRITPRALGNGTLPSRYVFATGDSYTTTGFQINGTLPSVSNPFGNPAYPGATLTGGENYIDILVHNYLPNRTVAYNLAVGSTPVNLTRVGGDPSTISGSVKDMIDQVTELEFIMKNLSSTPSATPLNTLSLNWFGINDVSIAGGLFFNTRQLNISQVEQILTLDVQDYFKQLQRIYRLGIRQFITFLLPPLVRTPFYGNGNSTSADRVRNLTKIWNDLIQDGHSKFMAENVGVKSSIFDPAPTFDYVLDNYATYGAPNNTCYSYPNGTPCLWHDFIHPGLALSKVLGKSVYDHIKNSTALQLR